MGPGEVLVSILTPGRSGVTCTDAAKAHSNPGTVLALRARVCELTEVDLRNWYFREPC